MRISGERIISARLYPRAIQSILNRVYLAICQNDKSGRIRLQANLRIYFSRFRLTVIYREIVKKNRDCLTSLFYDSERSEESL